MGVLANVRICPHFIGLFRTIRLIKTYEVAVCLAFVGFARHLHKFLVLVTLCDKVEAL